MRGFTHRVSVADAWQWIDRLGGPLGCEQVALDRASQRVVARDVVSDCDVPSFRRAMMDGYAVRARDTAGATPYDVCDLHVVGRSLPGRPFDGTIDVGDVVEIMTGAPLPHWADAVIPVEKTESIGPSQIRVIDQVPPLKHVGFPGEDIVAGTTLFAAGRRLRPQDLGVLSSVGCSSVSVWRRPRVHIVVTGNEILPAGSRPRDASISDANGPMLMALVARDGGDVVARQIVPDQRDAIRSALLSDADVILVSGGSSVGAEDHAPSLVEECGSLAIHGIAMRPSSPTGMGTIGTRTIFLLPGNPVSCLCAYDFFAGRHIRLRGGLAPAWPYRSERLPLQRKLVSVIGRCDYARVTVHDGQVVPLAVSGASVLTSTTRADGFVVVPEEFEGHRAGAVVEVFYYE